MLKIAIILGSTRPGRKSEAVGKWVLEHAQKRTDAEFELVDLRDFNLPHFDEPNSPASGKYTHEHSKVWSQKISTFDGFVFVTPEYNRSTSGVLKNAIDYLYKEWNNKAAGFVSYGGVGGARAVEHLRSVMGEIQIADVRQQVTFMLATDWENQAPKPGPHHEKGLKTLLDQLVAWSTALKPLRSA